MIDDPSGPPARPDEVPARVHVRVTGRVQGVYFRSTTAAQARALGLTGWVRNLPNGTVEVVAEGPKGALTRLVLWCHDGPAAARVESAAAVWADATGEFPDFRVRDP